MYHLHQARKGLGWHSEFTQRYNLCKLGVNDRTRV